MVKSLIPVTLAFFMLSSSQLSANTSRLHINPGMCNVGGVRHYYFQGEKKIASIDSNVHCKGNFFTGLSREKLTLKFYFDPFAGNAKFKVQIFSNQTAGKNKISCTNMVHESVCKIKYEKGDFSSFYVIITR
jgi:hypothetical protein